jgi:hypothetical protein
MKFQEAVPGQAIPLRSSGLSILVATQHRPSSSPRTCQHQENTERIWHLGHTQAGPGMDFGLHRQDHSTFSPPSGAPSGDTGILVTYAHPSASEELEQGSGRALFHDDWLPGAQGLFSTLQKRLRHPATKYHLHLSTSVNDFLDDFRCLAATLLERPTKIAELSPQALSTIGASDAAKDGMGGLHFILNPDGTVYPILCK